MSWSQYSGEVKHIHINLLQICPRHRSPNFIRIDWVLYKITFSLGHDVYLASNCDVRA